MLYHLFAPLADQHIFYNVFRYVTFRSIAAFLTAFLFSIFLGPMFIKMLKNHQFVETINDVVPESHKSKEGTPTMGGLIIILGLLLSTLLWNDLTNSNVLIMVLTVLWLGGIGFLDDFLKNIKKTKKGLVAKYKLLGQISLSLIIALILYFSMPDNTAITSIGIPFFKSVTFNFGIFFIPFVIFMIVGTSNAVNLTDGLDGLASGTISIAAFALGIMAYIKGNYNLATYFNMEFLAEAGELTIFTASIMGTILGFLWYNTKPASIFMGDTGSLALGGVLSTMAILLREEIFFAIVGGIFVVEAMSSIMQRYYFKYTRKKYGVGKRIFRCAPLHHHFEKMGLSEEKIVIRFWIVAMLLAAIGLATIKLR